MSTLIKIIITTLLSLLLFSCNFSVNLSPGIKGNGNVTEEERGVTAPFNTIKVSKGLHVILTQSNTENIIVMADDNLHELIVTEVINGVLKIYSNENIGHAEAKKIFVNFTDVSKISSSSGSHLKTNKMINTKRLELNSASGSNMRLEVNATVLECKSSSGSQLRLAGQAETFVADASSGSNIKAGKLKAEYSEVKASSGANITLNTSKKLIAKASSGGNINYYGNPEKVKKNNSISGNIRKK